MIRKHLPTKSSAGMHSTLFDSKLKKVNIKTKKDYYKYIKESQHRVSITVHKDMLDILQKHFDTYISVPLYRLSEKTKDVYIYLEGWNFPIEVFDILEYKEAQSALKDF